MNLSEYHQLSQSADNGYLLLVLTGVMLAWLGAALWQYVPAVRRLSSSMTLISKRPLPYHPMFWIIGVAAGVRVPRLFEEFWYDELFTAAFTRVPASDYLNTLLADVHPPLAYAPIWLVARLFDKPPEWALRSPSLVFGLLSLYVVYRLGKALKLSEGVALTASLLVAMLPSHIYYSVEARGYALYMLLILTAMLALLENRRRLFVVSAMLIPYVHNIGYIQLAVLCVIAVLYHRFSWRWIKSGAIASMAAALWIPFMLQQSGDISDGFWIPPLTLAGTLKVINLTTMTEYLTEFAVIVTYVGFAMLLVWVVGASWRWLFKSGWVVAAMTIVPPVLLAGASFAWQPVYLQRGMITTGVLLMYPFAIALNRPRSGLLQHLTLVIFAVAILGYVGKGPFSEDYQTACADADYFFASEIQAGMIAAYYLDKPLFMNAYASDMGQTLPPHALKSMGFELVEHISELEGATVCIIDYVSPFSGEREADLIQQITLTYPYEHWSESENPEIAHTDYYIVELKNAQHRQ